MRSPHWWRNIFFRTKITVTWITKCVPVYSLLYTLDVCPLSRTGFFCINIYLLCIINLSTVEECRHYFYYCIVIVWPYTEFLHKLNAHCRQLYTLLYVKLFIFLAGWVVFVERQKVDKKSKPTQKLKHTNSILESFEYFCQISSKSIVLI